MKDILIVVDNLVMGGVTRVLANMLNVISPDKYSVDLLVIHRHSDMNIDIPKNVRIIEAGEEFSAVDVPMGTLLRQKNIKKIISKLLFGFKIKTGLIKRTILKDRARTLEKAYDIEIAYGDGFPFFYVGSGNTPKKIAWMHSDVMIMDYSARYYRQMKKMLTFFNECAAVSEKVAESYKIRYNVKNISVIPNVVKSEEIISKSLENTETLPFDKNQINFITVGRLDYSKNYEMLARVTKRLADKGYNFKTYIIGDGADREKLEELIKELNISDRLILLGRRDNPYMYVKYADAFLLSSRYEGLPTVIIEALILHIPCISTNVAGVKKLIGENYGIITENNEEAFLNGIENVLDDSALLENWKQKLANYKYDNTEAISGIEKIIS